MDISQLRQLADNPDLITNDNVKDILVYLLTRTLPPEPITREQAIDKGYAIIRQQQAEQASIASRTMLGVMPIDEKLRLLKGVGATNG